MHARDAKGSTTLHHRAETYVSVPAIAMSCRIETKPMTWAAACAFVPAVTPEKLLHDEKEHLPDVAARFQTQDPKL